jgi:hypothetical protein
MKLAEVDTVTSWPGRNHLSKHRRLLDDDPRYALTAGKHAKWKPPVGWDKLSPSSL